MLEIGVVSSITNSLFHNSITIKMVRCISLSKIGLGTKNNLLKMDFGRFLKKDGYNFEICLEMIF